MLQSHTATEQWQSFEMRMRRRRVERCLLRASVAIEAGVLDDAREAIEEIRVLDPTEPGLEQLTAQLADAENPKPIEPELPAEAAPDRAPARHHRFAAAGVLLACALGGGWWWTSTLSTSPVVRMAVSSTQQASQPVTKPAPDPFVGVSQTSVSVPISEESRPAADSPLATTGTASLANPEPDVRPAAITETPAPVDALANTRIPEPVQSSPASTRSDERPALADNRNSAVVAPVADPAPPVTSPQPTASARLEPLTGLPEPAPASPRVVAGAEGIAPPEAAARSAETLTALPSPPPPDAATTRSEEQSVRAALGRYESAYNRLDAAAAAGVWPTVNQRALASAFHGLSAQSISLGGCQIRVNGATAHAECAGNARWTPKVGSGTQSAARQWRFDLRNSGGNWIITQASTR